MFQIWSLTQSYWAHPVQAYLHKLKCFLTIVISLWMRVRCFFRSIQFCTTFASCERCWTTEKPISIRARKLHVVVATTGLRPHVHVSMHEVVVTVYCISLCGSRCTPSRCLHERSQRPSSPLDSVPNEHLGLPVFWTFSPSLHVNLDSIIHSFLLRSGKTASAYLLPDTRQRVGDQPSRIRSVSSRLDTEADTLHGYHDDADDCHN